MEMLIGAVIVLLVIIGIADLGSSKGAKPPISTPGRSSTSTEQRILDDNLPWLQERWKAAYEQPEGEPGLAETRPRARILSRRVGDVPPRRPIRKILERIITFGAMRRGRMTFVRIPL